MNARDAIKNLRTGDVEIGFAPLKRMAADINGWVCERCGETKHGRGMPKDDAKPTCKSKSHSHRWRRV